MSKIMFFCIPAQGHTNPTLGVVRELIAGGHSVRYYSYEPLREKIESTGAEFVPCDDYDCEQKLTPADGDRLGKDMAFSTKILVDTTLELDSMVCQDMEQWKPDCVVADSMAIWGRLAARKRGITFAFNQYSSKIMKRSGKELLGMLFSMPKINKQIRRLQDHGYPVNSVLDIIANDENTETIVYTSPEFQPCAETFSDKFAFVGPSIRPVTEPVRKEREKLVYISMGTVNNDLLPLYRRCIAALKDRPYQVILSVGQEQAWPAAGEYCCFSPCGSDGGFAASGCISFSLRHEQCK